MKTTQAKLSKAAAKGNNNCAVVAIAALLSKGYMKTQRELVKKEFYNPEGKGWGKGMHLDEILEFLRGKGAKAIEVEGLEKKHVKTAINKLKRDNMNYQGTRYLIITSKHALALVENKIHDTSHKPNSKVLWVFKIELPVAEKFNPVFNSVLASTPKGGTTIPALMEELNLSDKGVRNLIDSSRRSGKAIINTKGLLTIPQAA